MYWILILITVGSGTTAVSVPCMLPQHFQTETACDAVLNQWLSLSGLGYTQTAGKCLLMPAEVKSS